MASEAFALIRGGRGVRIIVCLALERRFFSDRQIDSPMSEFRKTVLQAVRFALVSAVSLTIDYGVYHLLAERFEVSSSWAKRISFACIAIWGFFAHKLFTFRKRRYRASEPIRFALLYFTGWMLNSAVHDLAADSGGASNPAFLVATFVWACWNFAGQKLFVFGPGKSDSP